MNPKIGMHLPNGASDITDALSFGFGSYLVVHHDTAFEQVAAIRRAQPDARIYLRRYGGIGGSPQGVAYECAALLDRYGPWGVRDIIGWNEPDRAEEGGFNAAYIRDFALAYLTVLREIAPEARIHWPALAHVERYQDPDQWIWLPAAAQFDVFDCHAYSDPANAAAFFRWCEARLPGKPVVLTEYNYGPGNARPDDYGAWLYEVYRLAHEAPHVEAVTPFIWEWINPEAGVGQSLDIRRDPSALAGIRRAVADFRVEPPPEPEPPAPPEPEKQMDPIVKSMMLWQADHCRENTIEDWVRTLSLGGITVLKLKTHHARTWMARNYSHPLAPASAADVARLYDGFKAHGITFVPWCVPMLLDLEAEAQLAIDVARAAGGRIEIDLEVGDEFIGTAYRRRIVPYFQILADAEITVDVDTACFTGWMDALAIEEISGLVRRISSQSYDVGFKKPYAEVIQHDIATLRSVTDGEIGVVLDARAGRGIVERAAFAQSLGAVEVSCWAADMATAETYAGFALIPGKPDEDEPVEPPAPSNDDLYRANMAAAERGIAAFRRIYDLSTPGLTVLPDGTPVPDDATAVAGIAHALGEVDKERLIIADLTGQVRA